MTKFLTALVAVAATFCVNAEVWTAAYGVAESFPFEIWSTDGLSLDVDETDAGTDATIRCNDAAEAATTNDYTDEGTTYEIDLTATEMQCEYIVVTINEAVDAIIYIQTHSNGSARNNIAAASFTAGAIDAAAIAADAIGASELATDAIGAAEIGSAAIAADEIAADAIGASELATDAIGATELASAAIAADEIATDAIGAAEIASAAIAADEIAASAIGESELATGAITTAEFAAGAIDAAAIAADAVGASELATDAIGAAEIASAAIAAAEIADGAIDEATYATTAGSFDPLDIVDQGTAQSATGTTLVLRAAAAFADDELIGSNILITGGTGVGQVRTITDYVSATDTATVATWTTTPSGTILYQVEAAPPGAGGSVTIGAGGISASSFAAGAIDASAIAADAIGASELATDAIGAAEIASAAIAADEIATDAIGAAEIAAGAIAEDAYATTAGSFDALGIVDQGTAQSATGTTLVLRAAAAFADDEILGSTILITGGTGVGQSRVITDYVSTTDTATVSTWTTTPSGTILYEIYGSPPTEVWNATARTLTALDEDSTTIDLNASYVGGVTVLDEDLTTVDLNATPVVAGSITDGAIAAADFAAGAIDAAAIATDAIGAAEIAAAAITNSELASDGSEFTAIDLPNQTMDITGTLSTVTTATNVTTVNGFAADALVAADIASDVGTEIAAAVLVAQQSITGTCDSGSTTTCVDNALDQADATQLEDRLICFDDEWCGLITTFTPASDTVTTTKVAPSTRASKVYTIFPSTLE
jgi:hypothetical protein